MEFENNGVEFQYSFISGLGAYEHERYVKEVLIHINLTDEMGTTTEKMGCVKFLMIYIDQSWDAPYPLYEIFDAHSEYLARHIFTVFDTETNDFNKKINQHFNYEIHGSNVCLIQEISILPKYRGFKIGAKVMKDLLFHYSSACGLFVPEPYPLQFESAENLKRRPTPELEGFGQNKVQAFKKLSNYYKSIGFESVKGIKDLLLFNPVKKNKKLGAIDLEDSEIFSRDN